MKTAYEVGKDGITPLRIWHQGGANGRYSWTHAVEERSTCLACQTGSLPRDVLAGTKRSV